MKCRKCGEKAAIHMRQHKLALCSAHFQQWVHDQTARNIKKYAMFGPEDKVLVAVSGGKDSLALWDILLSLGYSVDGMYIGLGIDEGLQYSEISRSLAAAFAQEKSQQLLEVDFPETYGITIPELSLTTRRGHEKPCSVCGLSKRHIMNSVALEGQYDVLVTGHNLDDEAATLFGNTLNWLDGYLLRQHPVLEQAPGLVRKAKPLCRFYEREMAAYALLKGIEYVEEECPFSVGAKTIYYKEMLNRLEMDRPGAKLSFYLSFLQAKERGLFAKDKDIPSTEMRPCPECGQLTSSTGLCAFCRIILSQ